MLLKKIDNFVKPKNRIDNFDYFSIFYKCLQVLFCLNLGIFENTSKRIRYTQKYLFPLVNISLSVVAITYTKIYLPSDFIKYIGYYCFQSVCFAIVLLFKNVNLANFLRNNKKIDANLNVTLNTEKKCACVIFSFCVFKMFLVITWGIIGDGATVWAVIIGLYFWLIQGLFSLTNAAVFFCINHRLKSLTESLERSNVKYDALNNIYKDIVDNAETVKEEFDSLFTLRLMFNLPEFMYYLYIVIAFFKDEVPLELYVAIVNSLIYLAVSISECMLPAIVVGFLSSQANRIKVLLNNKLLQNQDPAKRNEIIDFITYIDARPLKYFVYEVFPLNVNLIGMVFQFCATYLIVIIQFSHLY